MKSENASILWGFTSSMFVVEFNLKFERVGLCMSLHESHLAFLLWSNRQDTEMEPRRAKTGQAWGRASSNSRPGLTYQQARARPEELRLCD